MVWTVNADGDLVRWVAAPGVDALMTDRPAPGHLPARAAAQSLPGALTVSELQMPSGLLVAASFPVPVSPAGIPAAFGSARCDGRRRRAWSGGGRCGGGLAERARAVLRATLWSSRVATEMTC